jgi:glycosyltransferase involved in cell wall biosynthesis
MKLRILFVSEYFYPRAAGGEIWSWELCTSLAKRGYEVTVITSRNDKTKADETINGIHILRPVMLSAHVNARLERYVTANKLSNYVASYLAKNKVDIIHVMAFALNVQVSRIAKERKIPCITSVHSYFGNSWNKIAMAGSLLKHMERRTLIKDVSAVIHVPSQYLQERILQDTKRTAKVIHNWIGTIEKAPQPMQKTLLYVGSLEKIKNPLPCIEAAKMLEAKLIVIGTGTLEQKMKEEAQVQGIDYVQIPSCSRVETLKYIGSASLLLVPSITESFSLVALEAAAQGTPISGTPVGIIPELPGVIPFPPQFIPERLTKTVQNQIRKKFDRENIITEFEELYKVVRK